jgi:hypothetical protein
MFHTLEFRLKLSEDLGPRPSLLMAASEGANMAGPVWAKAPMLDGGEWTTSGASTITRTRGVGRAGFRRRLARRADLFLWEIGPGRNSTPCDREKQLVQGEPTTTAAAVAGKTSADRSEIEC